MSQANRDGSKGFNTSAAIARGQRVVLAAAGTVSAAGVGVEGIGTAYDSVASGVTCSVELDHKSVEAIASGAITIANPCYAAAAGRVSATVSGRRIGIALSTGSDGNKFEMMLAGAAS
jgi:hypothetical protein